MNPMLYLLVILLTIISCKNRKNNSVVASQLPRSSLNYCQAMASGGETTSYRDLYQSPYDYSTTSVKDELQAREVVTKALIVAYTDFKDSITTDPSNKGSSSWRITPDNFKRWAGILQDMQRLSFEKGEKLLNLSGKSPKEKNAYLGRFSYLVTHSLISAWVTAGSLGYIAHEIGHLETAKHYGSEAFVGDIISKKEITIYDLYMRLVDGGYYDQVAWHQGAWTDAEDAAVSGAGINQNTQRAEDCYLSLLRGDGHVSQTAHCLVNKTWGIRYFYNDQAGNMDDHADPHQYIESLNNQGFDVKIEDVTNLLAATSLLSGLTLSYFNGVMQYIATGETDVVPLAINIGSASVTLPGLAAYLNDTHVSTKITTGIQMNSKMLVILASEMSVYGKELPADYYVDVDYSAGDFIYNLNLNRSQAGDVGGGGKITYDTNTGKFYLGAKYHSGTTRADKRDLLGNGMAYTVGFSKGNTVGELAIAPDGSLSEAFYLSFDGEIDFCNPRFLSQSLAGWGIPDQKLLDVGSKLAELANEGILSSFRYRLLAGLRDNKNISTQALLSLGIHVTVIEGAKVLRFPAGILPAGMLTTDDSGIITDYALGGDLAIDQLTKAQFSPEFVVKSYIMDLKTQVQVAVAITEVDVQIRFGQAPLALVAGVNIAAEGISPEIGASIRHKNGLGSSFVFAPLTLGFILMDKESIIYGDTESGISCKIHTGCRMISRKNTGKKWVLNDGTVFAEKRINSKDGLLSLFQFNDKPWEVKQQITRIYSALKSLLDNQRSVFFKEQFLEEIAEYDALVKFGDFITQVDHLLVDTILQDHDNKFRAITFDGLHGTVGAGFKKDKTNIFDAPAGILSIRDIETPLPNLSQEMSRFSLAQVINHIRSDAVKGLLHDVNSDGRGLRVVVDTNTLPLNDKAEEGLEKLLFYMKHYLTPSQFHNRLLLIKHATSFRAFTEFIGLTARYRSFTGSAIIQMSDSMLEELSHTHLGEMIYDARRVEIEEGKRVSLFIEYMQASNLTHTGMKRVVFLNSREFSDLAESVDEEYYAKMPGQRETHFIQDDSILYANIERVDELNHDGGFWGVGSHARSLLERLLRPATIRGDVFKLLPFLNLLSEEGKRIKMLKEASGQAEFILTQFFPENLSAPVQEPDGTIRYTYALRDAYFNPQEIKDLEARSYQDKIQFVVPGDFSTIRVILTSAEGASREFDIGNESAYNSLFQIHAGVAIIAVRLFMQTGPSLALDSDEAGVRNALSLYNKQNNVSQRLLQYQQASINK